MAASRGSPAAADASRRGGGRSYPLLSRREIEALIAEGRTIFILDRHVIKADAWLPYHPGGDKAIMHMVGRDATDEVNGFHSLEARRMMDKYRIGRIEGRWRNFVPPIQGGKFRPRVSDGEDEQEDEYGVSSLITQRLKEDVAALSSYSSSTRSPSPTFDANKDAALGLRKRRSSGGIARSSSATSLSSGDDDEDGAEVPAPPVNGMAHLDVLTRKEIKLDLSRYPPPDPVTQEAIAEKYRLLHERIKAEGLYDCNYSAYAIEVCRYTLFFVLFLVFLRWKWYIPSGFFLGVFWHQLAFTVHDAGHLGITHDFQTDTVIGILVADFLGGLSVCWWKRNHNVHHIVTNSPEHDPDIEHMPFFAISHRFLGSLRSTYYERVMQYDAAARFFISLQHYLYYVILLFGRFNLYRLSWAHILLGQGPRRGPAAWHRWLEMAGQVFFWTWFGYGVVYRCVDTGAWDRFVFVMVSHMVTTPLHVQITLSHFAMSTADLGVDESFPQKMLRTTMDVDCPQWLDFFHGGLQFQAIHHLFPRIPRHNLRKTQRLVQEFCDEVGIPYALYGFVDGNRQVIGRLADVARQAAILAKCQSVLVSDGGGHHHHH
ncbi:fatty acid delta-6 desaturase [Parathielavia appendiculata]|uniref:Delta 8-(E)-sphingolipid desaturase n=1 Tax=Parathielavia appendiculata TaxID=2587402 RepID=A0AAN6Z404_9PEZI|nr:fatty acid delta-6 desaturase [Parathielavia appendiculata]